MRRLFAFFLSAFIGVHRRPFFLSVARQSQKSPKTFSLSNEHLAPNFFVRPNGHILTMSRMATFTQSQSNTQSHKSSAPLCTDLLARTSRLLLVSQQDTERFESLLEEFKRTCGSTTELDQTEAAVLCLWLIWQTNHASEKTAQGVSTRHISPQELAEANKLLQYLQINRVRRQKYKQWLKNSKARVEKMNAQTVLLTAKTAKLESQKN
jgi:hypothetical protein